MNVDRYRGCHPSRLSPIKYFDVNVKERVLFSVRRFGSRYQFGVSGQSLGGGGRGIYVFRSGELRRHLPRIANVCPSRLLWIRPRDTLSSPKYRFENVESISRAAPLSSRCCWTMGIFLIASRGPLSYVIQMPWTLWVPPFRYIFWSTGTWKFRTEPRRTQPWLFFSGITQWD